MDPASQRGSIQKILFTNSQVDGRVGVCVYTCVYKMHYIASIVIYITESTLLYSACLGDCGGCDDDDASDEAGDDDNGAGGGHDGEADENNDVIIADDVYNIC